MIVEIAVDIDGSASGLLIDVDNELAATNSH